MFIAQVLVGPSKQLKQTIQTEPQLAGVNQLAISKRGWWFELKATVKEIQVVVKARTRHPWIVSSTRWPLGHGAAIITGISR